MGFNFSELIINFTLYAFVVAVIFLLTRERKKVNAISIGYQHKNNIGYFTIILIALILTLLNIVITVQANRAGRINGDRLFYSNFFNADSKDIDNIQGATEGLKWVYYIVHAFTNNSLACFYVSTFICVLLTLIAYKKNESALPLACLFLILNEWFFSTYINLKQCYCSAFAALFFTYALKQQNLKNVVLCIVFICLAYAFHVAGFVLLLVYLLMLLQRRKDRTGLYLVLFVFVILFFKPLIILGATALKPIFPSLYSKVSEYFIADSNMSDSFSFVKGLPFYYITFIGFTRKKQLHNKIYNYRNYLLLSMVASMCYILAIYDVWMFRLTYLFYLPVGIFFAQIEKENNDKNRKRIDLFLVFGSLAFLIFRYIVVYHINYGGFSGAF